MTRALYMPRVNGRLAAIYKGEGGGKKPREKKRGENGRWKNDRGSESEREREREKEKEYPIIMRG